MSTATLTKPKPAKSTAEVADTPSPYVEHQPPPEYLSRRYAGPMLFEQPPQPPERARKRFSVEEFEAIAAMGMLPNHVELVDGEIIEMPAQSNDHSLPKTDFYDILRPLWTNPRFIRCQDTHRFPSGWGPEPDLALLDARPKRRAIVDPFPRLVIEVSVKTLSYDLNEKRLRYAREGVPEYWVADVEHRLLHVFRQPILDASDPDLAWGQRLLAQPGDGVSPLCLPDVRVAVDDVMPPDDEE